MRASFYEGARTFRTGSQPMPVPGPEEALLRVRRVGICGTDLHIFQGSRLYAREDWDEAIRLAASGAVPVRPRVSRKIPLEELQQGMEHVLAGGAVMKVLVDLTA